MGEKTQLLLGWLLCCGACLGSFAGVCISRWPQAQSVCWPRSHCDACQRVLPWYDNIPLLSFVFLRRRCRVCRQPIAWRFWWLEWMQAGLAVALGMRWGCSVDLCLWLPLSWMLLVVTFLDIDYFWIPDKMTYPAMLWALVFACLPGRGGFGWVLAGLLPSLMLWGVGSAYGRWRQREALGLGDVKLLVVIGLALGYQATLLVLLLAALQGALLGMLILWRGGHRPPALTMPASTPAELAENTWVPPAQALPFGPFLSVATLQVVLLPQLFVSWSPSFVAL